MRRAQLSFVLCPQFAKEVEALIQKGAWQCLPSAVSETLTQRKFGASGNVEMRRLSAAFFKDAPRVRASSYRSVAAASASALSMRPSQLRGALVRQFINTAQVREEQ